MDRRKTNKQKQEKKKQLHSRTYPTETSSQIQVSGKYVLTVSLVSSVRRGLDDLLWRAMSPEAKSFHSIIAPSASTTGQSKDNIISKRHGKTYRHKINTYIFPGSYKAFSRWSWSEF